MKKRRVPPPPDKPVRFIPCNESTQTFNFQRTNRKSTYRDLNVTDTKQSNH